MRTTPTTGGTSCSCSTASCRNAGCTTINTGRGSSRVTHQRPSGPTTSRSTSFRNLIDPSSGWHQNANEPPWLMTLPRLDRTKFPAYVAPTGQALPQMRTLRSLRMITEDAKISYEQLLAKKHSTRMELADRVLPDLLRRRGIPMPDGCLRRGIAIPMSTAGAPSYFSCLSTGIFLPQPAGWTASFASSTTPNGRSTSAHGLADAAGAAAALSAAADECRAAVRRARREVGRRVSFRKRERRSSLAMGVPAARGSSGRSRLPGVPRQRGKAATGITRRAARRSYAPSSSRALSARSACSGTATRRSPGRRISRTSCRSWCRKSCCQCTVKRKTLKPI